MNLTRHILDILKRVSPQGLFATTLRAELHFAIGREPGDREMTAALSRLKELGWVETEEDALTRDLAYKVSELGKGK